MKYLSVLFISLFILSACQNEAVSDEAYSDEEASPMYRKISPEEAMEKMSQDGVLIVDVREASEYAQGHVVDAILLPLGKVQAGELDLIPDKNQVILIYCRSGNRSAQAAKVLVELGYSNIYDFGGIIDWPYEVVK